MSTNMSFSLSFDLQEIKVRRPFAPTTRVVNSKKIYSRKGRNHRSVMLKEYR
jgi:hypothetical protein